MKVVLICGSHRRHLYIAEKLYRHGFLGGIVIEKREEFLPEPPKDLLEQDRENFIRHFKARDTAENKFFHNADIEKIKKEVKYIEVTKETLNDDETLEFIKSIKPDYVVSYGVHKISDELIEEYKNCCFNIHGGLSPWFKGSITLFWPFYFLKPNWAGMTIHCLSNRIDAGDIIHHSVPVLQKGDKIHEVACKAVVQVANDLCKIFDIVESGKKLKPVPQVSNGKLFVNKDWTPQTLRLIYNTFNDDIVDKFLDGEIISPDPILIRQF